MSIATTRPNSGYAPEGRNDLLVHACVSLLFIISISAIIDRSTDHFAPTGLITFRCRFTIDIAPLRGWGRHPSHARTLHTCAPSPNTISQNCPHYILYTLSMALEHTRWNSP